MIDSSITEYKANSERPANLSVIARQTRGVEDVLQAETEEIEELTEAASSSRSTVLD
jgi:hypothetical protein